MTASIDLEELKRLSKADWCPEYDIAVLKAAPALIEELEAAREELEACNRDWNLRYQRMLETESQLRKEIAGLRSFRASVDEALNTGNGTYKP